MKHVPLASSSNYRFGRYFTALLGLCIILMLPMAQATVTVDQKPLTVQASLAPNIVLMLDDSGSMAWNFMPDICFLGSYCDSSLSMNAKPLNDALINASVNGVYYNPSVTYTPPVKANGSSFDASPGLTGAWPDGFAAVSQASPKTTVDLTTYAATSTYSSSNYTYSGTHEQASNGTGTISGKSNIAFSTAKSLSTTTTTTLTPTCNTGYTLAGSGSATLCVGNAAPTCSSGTYNSATGTCTVTPPTPTCPSGSSLSHPGSTYLCTATPTCSSGTFTSSSGTCAVTPPAPACPSGSSMSKIAGTGIFTCNATPACSSGTFNATTGVCTVTPPTPTCSTSGTSLSKPTGASQWNCNSTPTCVPSGSYNNTTDTCSSGGTRTCPAGTTRGKFSGANIYTCNATVAPSCSSGTFTASSGTCAVTPPAPTCPSGTSLSKISGAGTYNCNSTPTCSPGSFNSSTGVCTVTPPAPTCPSGTSLSQPAGSSSYMCNSAASCSSGSYSSANGTCVVTPPAPSCPTGGSVSLYNTTYQCIDTTPNCTTSGYSYASSTGLCTQTTTSTANYNFFQYSTGSSNTVYYVASTTQGCATQANCYLENDATGAAAPIGIAVGQNIANWYSYYHTRMLMAKSGLMTAFSDIDPTIRVGFGSINGNNKSALPSPYPTTGSYQIAAVQPFDTGNTGATPVIGGAGTQRANFWAWVIGESPNSTTPLRAALNAVGQYYMTAGPWQTSSTDSTELACRQSYTILTTDGFWNDSFSSAGNVDNTSTTTAITGPNSQSYTYTAAAPYAGATSNTLADVAMKYWLTDLRPALNEVPTSTEDPAFWQHMTTFTLGLGFTPTGISPSTATIPQIFKWANGGAAISGFSWPAPASNSVNNIADLAHAAVNGHGGFYSATSPQAFSSGVADAINRVATRVGTGASLAANSTKLGTGTVTYQALYYTGKWTGDLKAYAVNSTTGAIATASTWAASTALPAAASRNIKTYNPSGTTTATKFVAFSDPASLSNTEKTALGSSTTIQQSRINYLRGDATGEVKNNGTYRNRDTALGDIINSQPVYVGAPSSNLFYGKTFSGSGSYPAFATGKLTRTAAIWVAANDGMLHAFQASNGVELFAYLPGSVITNGLANLSDPNYGENSVPHQLFNDGEITVADVYTGTTPAWRTVLVGTTGRGPAKAVYALDITDPATPSFLWERSAGDGGSNSDYIGQTTGQPVIAQVADGSWSVIMGNGYNSSQNKAALLQFDITDGTLTVHTTDSNTNNGLAAPVAWIGTVSNGISTIAYAGDLKGQVWSFVLNNGTSSTPGSTGSLLFTTLDSGSSGKAQPITAGLLAGKDPKTGNVWLFFGTGKYLTQSDLSNTDKQTWYGIIVQSTTSALVTNLSTWTGSRTAGSTNALVPRSITAQTDATSTKLAARTITVSTAGDMSGKSGWFIDLIKPPSTAQGESMVTPNQFQGSLLLGTSRVPVVTDPCNPSGSGWIMALDPFTGGNPSARFFDLNNDQKFDSNDDVNSIPAGGVGFGSVANNPIFVSNTMLVSFDNATTSSVDTAGTVGTLSRLSWRELVNH